MSDEYKAWRDILRAGGMAVAGAFAAALPIQAQTSAEARGIYNVRDFGASGDGRSIDSAAINKTIEAAAAATKPIHDTALEPVEEKTK